MREPLAAQPRDLGVRTSYHACMEKTFVAYLDIVGFKALRKKLGSDGLLQRVTRAVVPAIEHASATAKKLVEVGGQKHLIADFSTLRSQFRYFSDSVIFWQADASLKSFIDCVVTVRELMSVGFAAQVPFRGAIGIGDFCVDAATGSFVGTALEDAYVAAESTVWAGCVLTPAMAAHAVAEGHIEAFTSACRASSDPKIAKHVSLFVDHEVEIQTLSREEPRSYRREKLIVLNWTLNMFPDASVKCFQPTNNNHALRIIGNTQSFEKQMRNPGQELM